jgi:hypothetical protein
MPWAITKSGDDWLIMDAGRLHGSIKGGRPSLPRDPSYPAEYLRVALFVILLFHRVTPLFLNLISAPGICCLWLVALATRQVEASIGQRRISAIMSEQAADIACRC